MTRRTTEKKRHPLVQHYLSQVGEVRISAEQMHRAADVLEDLITDAEGRNIEAESAPRSRGRQQDSRDGNLALYLFVLICRNRKYGVRIRERWQTKGGVIVRSAAGEAQFSGLLEIEVITSFGSISSFKENRRSPVDLLRPQILDWIQADTGRAEAAEIRYAREQELRHQREAEEATLALERFQEEQRVKDAKEKASLWADIERLELYIAAVRGQAAEDGGEGTQTMDWLIWAERALPIMKQDALRPQLPVPADSTAFQQWPPARLSHPF